MDIFVFQTSFFSFSCVSKRVIIVRQRFGLVMAYNSFEMIAKFDRSLIESSSKIYRQRFRHLNLKNVDMNPSNTIENYGKILVKFSIFV